MSSESHAVTPARVTKHNHSSSSSIIRSSSSCHSTSNQMLNNNRPQTGPVCDTQHLSSDVASGYELINTTKVLESKRGEGFLWVLRIRLLHRYLGLMVLIEHKQCRTTQENTIERIATKPGQCLVTFTASCARSYQVSRSGTFISVFISAHVPRL